MRERMLTAWLLRSLLLFAAAVAIAAAAVVGVDNENGDVSFRLVLFGFALYVVSRILDKR